MIDLKYGFIPIYKILVLLRLSDSRVVLIFFGVLEIGCNLCFMICLDWSFAYSLAKPTFFYLFGLL